VTVVERERRGHGLNDVPAPKNDPYADCVCGHGRHTHAHYTGGCGLCDCAYVREAHSAKDKEAGT